MACEDFPLPQPGGEGMGSPKLCSPEITAEFQGRSGVISRFANSQLGKMANFWPLKY